MLRSFLDFVLFSFFRVLYLVVEFCMDFNDGGLVGLEPLGAVGDGGGVVCLMAHGMRLKVVGAKKNLEIKIIKLGL